MELEKGKTPFSPGTFECSEYPMCYYNQNGRCIYNVAMLKVEISRYCHNDIIEMEVECEADHAAGML